jgi:iron complex transport system substrate-binding protein
MKPVSGLRLPVSGLRLPVSGLRPRLRSERRVVGPAVTAAVLFALLVTGAAQPTPTRIISLVPALTEMAFAIGAGDKVVAVSSYDEDPPQVRALPKVGALIDPDVERIISLRPDLVLLYGSQADLMTQLTRASIPYFEYRHGGLSGVTNTIRLLGQRLGHATQANTLSSSIESRLSALRHRTAKLGKPRTLLVFGRESGSLRSIYASGGRGFLHDMLEAAGGINVFADVQAESVEASTEMILTRAPEVILELHSMAPPAGQRHEIDSWNRLASLPAVRTNRIYQLTGKSLVVPGPRVAEGAERMAAVLHPTQ